MNKNILIVGGGAAASALAKKIRKNDDINKIYIASGNCIKSEYYEVVDIRANDLTGLLKFALENDIHMTIPISEAAFGSDIVSFFQSNGQSIFGPVKDACNIALNKGSGKKFLYKILFQKNSYSYHVLLFFHFLLCHLEVKVYQADSNNMRMGHNHFYIYLYMFYIY